MSDTTDSVWPGHTGNWGRWDNDRGALNLISSAKVFEAIAEVVDGVVIPCSRPITDRDPTRDQLISKHEMTHAGANFPNDPDRDGIVSDHQSAGDTLWLRLHGMVNTHADALSHEGYGGFGFNGHPFDSMVTVEDGAKIAAITDALAVVTRGVLADIPRLRNVPYIEPGDSVGVDELRAVTPDLRPGDALVIRTGGTLIGGRPAEPGDADYHGRWAGLHADCMDYVRERDVAVLATDSPGDTFPSTIPESKSPIHVLAEVYLGLHVVHNMDLERLASECHERGRSSFLFAVASLHIPHGTGSPVTPFVII